MENEEMVAAVLTALCVWSNDLAEFEDGLTGREVLLNPESHWALRLNDGVDGSHLEQVTEELLRLPMPRPMILFGMCQLVAEERARCSEPGGTVLPFREAIRRLTSTADPDVMFTLVESA